MIWTTHRIAFMSMSVQEDDELPGGLAARLPRHRCGRLLERERLDRDRQVAAHHELRELAHTVEGSTDQVDDHGPSGERLLGAHRDGAHDTPTRTDRSGQGHEA